LRTEGFKPSTSHQVPSRPHEHPPLFSAPAVSGRNAQNVDTSPAALRTEGTRRWRADSNCRMEVLPRTPPGRLATQPLVFVDKEMGNTLDERRVHQPEALGTTRSRWKWRRRADSNR